MQDVKCSNAVSHPVFPLSINPNTAGKDMKEQIDILVNLQNIEIESAAVRTHLNAASRQLELLTRDQVQIESGINDETVKISELRKSYNDAESSVKDNQGLIKKSQERLNSIKNNREYQALLKEIEELKRINSATEDQMMNLMSQTEASEAKIAELQARLQTLMVDIHKEQDCISIETQTADKKLEELDTARREISGKVDADVLKLFHKIQSKQVKGIAVVPVQDAVCHGCYVNIPPQMYNELQRCDSLKMCPNCQRIIYWKQA